MMASSTTMPMARIRANSTMVLSEKPKTARAAKVPIRDTGMAMPGIRVVRQSPRKTKTTAMTSMIAMIRVSITSSMEALTKLVVS